MVAHRSAALAGFVLMLTGGTAEAQPAPLPSREIPYDPSGNQITIIQPRQHPAGLRTLEKMIVEEAEGLPQQGPYWTIDRYEQPGAAWLQLHFRTFSLGEGGVLTIRSEEDGEAQHFDQERLTAWQGHTGIFGGDSVIIELNVPPTDANVGYEIGSVTAGEPLDSNVEEQGSGGENTDVPPDNQPHAHRSGAAAEQICGDKDDRIASTDPRVGRMYKLGCTVFIVEEGVLVTAGHCEVDPGEIVDFNVPLSNSVGLPRWAKKKDQYVVILPFFRTHNDDSGVPDPADPHPGFGDDWAVFFVASNTETGLSPAEAQGASFRVHRGLPPGTARVTGYGIDNSPRSASQAQQSADGEMRDTTKVGGSEDVAIEHFVDTRVGNSGSPIVAIAEAGEELVVGIHEAGQCDPGTNDPNFGTSFLNEKLWQAIQDARQRLRSG